MPIHWDSVNDAKLITAFQQTSQVDYDAIARFMGDGCTVSAVKHRLARIREKAGLQGTRASRGAQAGSSSSAGNSEIPAMPATPKKPANGSRIASTKITPQSAVKRGRKSGTTTPTKPKRVGSNGPIHANRGMPSKKTELKKEFKTVDGFPDLDYDDDDVENSSDEEAFAK